jgi:hypothetical protein
MYGKPFLNSCYGKINSASPVRQDSVLVEIARLGITPTAPRNNIGGMKGRPTGWPGRASSQPKVRQMDLRDLHHGAARRSVLGRAL